MVQIKPTFEKMSQNEKKKSKKTAQSENNEGGKRHR